MSCLMSCLMRKRLESTPGPVRVQALVQELSHLMLSWPGLSRSGLNRLFLLHHLRNHLTMTFVRSLVVDAWCVLASLRLRPLTSRRPSQLPF